MYRKAINFFISKLFLKKKLNQNNSLKNRDKDSNKLQFLELLLHKGRHIAILTINFCNVTRQKISADKILSKRKIHKRHSTGILFTANN